MTTHEITALCSRLEARANSKLMDATPEQQSDIRTAARLLRETTDQIELLKRVAEQQRKDYT